jgi:octaprenyl-diphosphate synthase
VLDEADKRRHVATVNAEWGTEPSLLLGDFLFTHAFQLAANATGSEACRWLARSTNRVCAGELHQVSRRGVFDLGEAEHLMMLEGKTAELFASACGLGASYAGAPARWVEALTEYGRCLGVAFQIADDVLDLVGEEAATGKSVGSDLRKQKMTLPLIYYRETAAPENVALLRRAFDDADAKARGTVSQLLADSDVLDRTKERGRAYVRNALDALLSLPDSPAKRSLHDLAQFSMDRSA